MHLWKIFNLNFDSNAPSSSKNDINLTSFTELPTIPSTSARPIQNPNNLGEILFLNTPHLTRKKNYIYNIENKSFKRIDIGYFNSIAKHNGTQSRMTSLNVYTEFRSENYTFKINDNYVACLRMGLQQDGAIILNLHIFNTKTYKWVSPFVDIDRNNNEIEAERNPTQLDFQCSQRYRAIQGPSHVSDEMASGCDRTTIVYDYNCDDSKYNDKYLITMDINAQNMLRIYKMSDIMN